MTKTNNQSAYDLDNKEQVEPLELKIRSYFILSFRNLLCFIA